ncbi:Hdr-like menaquinol oxidoreductase cytochrome c subunit [Candidatus Terasakiella magnetica]|nr:Hdr-like menaquinol oxidoreductase cytochrome c subunit [Candidatus Terasakiella magnetica]
MTLLARLLLGLMLTVTAAAAFAADFPALPKARGGDCVAAAPVMRRDHADMLKHQRDDTLRRGIRGVKASLKDCVACHSTDGADAKPVPITAPGQFCQTCHAYVAAKPDCFECHATTTGAAP